MLTITTSVRIDINHMYIMIRWKIWGQFLHCVFSKRSSPVQSLKKNALEASFFFTSYISFTSTSFSMFSPEKIYYAPEKLVTPQIRPCKH